MPEYPIPVKTTTPCRPPASPAALDAIEAPGDDFREITYHLRRQSESAVHAEVIDTGTLPGTRSRGMVSR